MRHRESLTGGYGIDAGSMQMAGMPADYAPTARLSLQSARTSEELYNVCFSIQQCTASRAAFALGLHSAAAAPVAQSSCGTFRTCTSGWDAALRISETNFCHVHIAMAGRRCTAARGELGAADAWQRRRAAGRWHVRPVRCASCIVKVIRLRWIMPIKSDCGLTDRDKPGPRYVHRFTSTFQRRYNAKYSSASDYEGLQVQNASRGRRGASERPNANRCKRLLFS